MRRYLFEFEDAEWFPPAIRRGMMDFLRYFMESARFYKPAVPAIAEAMQHTGDTRILELCTGGGGGIVHVRSELSKLLGKEVQVHLTDKYPNLRTFRFLAGKAHGNIGFTAEQVDATRVPEHMHGFRVMFSSTHHFSAGMIRSMLADAARNGDGIALVDVGRPNFWKVAGVFLGFPLLILLGTPFFRPFSISRLFFTYVVPAIVFCTVWDGIASLFRLYTSAELQKIADDAGIKGYTWKTGTAGSHAGISNTYVVGYPEKK